MMEELEPCLNGSVKSVREPEKKSSNTEELIPANFDLNITQMTPIGQADYSFNMEEREIAEATKVQGYEDENVVDANTVIKTGSLLMLTQFSEAKTDTNKGKNTSSYKEISDDKNDVNKGDKSIKDYDITEKGCQTVKLDVHGDGTTEVNVYKHEDLMDAAILDQIRQRTTRTIKLPDVLRSPFVRKKVSLVLRRWHHISYAWE
ncbi:hypothetical protein L1987_01519 [Smallanthus sonchifolius]|uniref:Uncharacterized protein n=1 Tax=Smallanthus sonchifolius TaxID=185202 RepID=A0ACB9K5A6_9ASTR|nr:hypothetical protein L1987_01519 [Smallanthus sonchifolius]